MSSNAADVERQALFWQRVARVLKVVVAVNVAVAVWVIGFRGGDEQVPVLPDTETQFSLDLEVIASADHPMVYVVEQRARPFYRVFSFDPVTGATETVYTVPEDAIIYGIALSPDQRTLALGYSPDFNDGGSGIWLFDLTSNDLSELRPVSSEVFLSDISWSSDGQSVFATEVDRRGDQELLAAVEIDIESGEIVSSVSNAIKPVEVDETLYYLSVDENKARRAVGVRSATGEDSTLEIGDSAYDLDHLVAVDGGLRVAVIEPDDDVGITIGEPADAHGNHDVPSEWWEIDFSNGDQTQTGFDPIIVYDAIATPDGIVYATNEGLAIAATERVDVITSRAIRLVAG